MDQDQPPTSVATWIDTQEQLDRAAQAWAREPSLAIDTEADSFFAYHVKICLIQISTAQEDYLVDPLAGLDLAPLGELCADPAVEIVMHGAANDVALLRSRSGFSFANLFDTMIAAQVLGLERTGLASLLEERFGVVQPKSFQRSDWRRRPLSDGQLRYASLDTHYLLELRRQLATELAELGRAEEAAEDFEALCHVEHASRGFDPDGFWSIRGVRQMTNVQARRVGALYRWREKVADAEDISPHRILGDRAILALAERPPRGKRELARSSGVSARLVREHGDTVLQRLREADSAPPITAPRARRRVGGAEGLDAGQKPIFEKLREWRRERAAGRGVDPSRIATTETLRGIVREGPADLEALADVAGMTPFRIREYGEEILTQLGAEPSVGPKPRRRRRS